MTPDEAVKLLEALSSIDPETSHVLADQVLVDFLRSNGFADVADAFDAASDRIGFWYA